MMHIYEMTLEPNRRRHHETKKMVVVASDHDHARRLAWVCTSNPLWLRSDCSCSVQIGTALSTEGFSLRFKHLVEPRVACKETQ